MKKWSYNWDGWTTGKRQEHSAISNGIISVLRKQYRWFESTVLKILQSKKMLFFSIAYAIGVLVISVCKFDAIKTENEWSVTSHIIRDLITSFGFVGLGVGLYKDAQAQRVDGVLLSNVIKYYNPYAVGYLILHIFYTFLGVVGSYNKNPVPALLCLVAVLAYLILNSIIIVGFMTPYGNVMIKTIEYAKKRLASGDKETIEKTELRRSIATSIADKYNEHSLRMDSTNSLIAGEVLDLNWFGIIIDNIKFNENASKEKDTIRIYNSIWEALLSSRRNIHSLHGLSAWIMYGIGIESTSLEDDSNQLKEARMFIGSWVYNIFLAHFANLIQWTQEESTLKNWGDPIGDEKKDFRKKLDKRLSFVTFYMHSMFEYTSLYHNTKERIDNQGKITKKKPEEIRDVLITVWIFSIIICIYQSIKHFKVIPNYLEKEVDESISVFVKKNQRIVDYYYRQDNKDSLIKWALYVSVILEDIAGIIPYNTPLEEDNPELRGLIPVIRQYISDNSVRGR